jgi:hypothetical protein
MAKMAAFSAAVAFTGGSAEPDASGFLTQATPAPAPLDCKHGNVTMGSDNKQHCLCDENYRVAGPTDIFHYLEGSCVQFTCKNTKQCQDLTGDDEATCDVPGWDCVCSWKNTIGWSIGKDFGQGKGTCMGKLYRASDEVVGQAWWLLSHMWMPFVPLIILLLPFGEKKIRCDCLDPRQWRVFFLYLQMVLPFSRYVSI